MHCQKAGFHRVGQPKDSLGPLSYLVQDNLLRGVVFSFFKCIFNFFYLLILERERGKEREGNILIFSYHSSMHSLVASSMCSDPGWDGTHNIGVSGPGSNQLSYPARASYWVFCCCLCLWPSHHKPLPRCKLSSVPMDKDNVWGGRIECGNWG